MKLKTLLVSGFKSFLDARLDFPQGVTAVVGPNGVGKSNVVDAVLWVLGEQSTKALRSERMEDVIFNGTESCQPVGMAEVSLVVSDVTSQELESIAGVMEELPGNKELMVTRRLYRDGESEYCINKIPCRLKDIRNLFWEGRAGAKGHTVIEQGNIDHILSGSPQDRRQFIEETAGIVRFKKQKLEALRKLKTTQDNLLRVRDIIAEVQKQRRTLERQAKQATQYHTLKDEARALELRLLTHDYTDLCRRRAGVDSELAALTSREVELMAEQARLMASHEDIKAAVLRDGELVGETQEALRQLETDIGQALTTMEVERNRAEALTQQRERAAAEQARLAAEAEQAARVMEELREQAQRAEDAMTRATGDVEALDIQGRAQADTRAAVVTQTEQIRQRVVDRAVERSQTESHLTNLAAKQDELLTRINDAQAEQDRCRQERADAEATLAGHHTQLRDMTAHIDADRARHVATSDAMAAQDERLRTLEEQRSAAHTERVAAESRLHALQAVLQEEFGYQGGRDNQPSLRDVCHGVKEALAERVEVPQEYEVAIEAVLGEHIRAWVVRGVETIPQALAFVKERGLGRATFVVDESTASSQPSVSSEPPAFQPSASFDPPTFQPSVSSEPPAFQSSASFDPPVSSDPFRASWDALRQARGVLGRAVDLVTVPDDLAAVWRCLLGRVALVETLEDGLAAMRLVAPDDRGGVLLVTRAGEVLDPRGIITGGGSGDAGGLLQRRREVRVLEQSVSDMATRLAEHDRHQQHAREQYDTHKQALHALDVSLKESEARRLAVEKEHATGESRLEDVARRGNVHHVELDACREELSRVREQAAAATTCAEDIEQRQREEAGQLEEVTARLRTLEEETSALAQRLTEARLTLTTYRERHDRAQADGARLRDEDQARRTQRNGLASQLTVFEAHLVRSRDDHRQADETFRELEERKTALEQRRRTVEERHVQGLQQSRDYERRLGDNHKQCASARDARAAAEIQLAEIRTRVQTVEDTIRGTYGESPDAAAALASAAEAAAATTVAAADSAVDSDGAADFAVADSEAVAVDTAVTDSEDTVAADFATADSDTAATATEVVAAAATATTTTDTPDVWQERLETVRAKMERMGPLNLAAIDEHRDLQERDEFLGKQAADLSESMQSLQEIITRLNRKTNHMFRETFEAIQEKFKEVFAAFFAGGKAELVLVKPDADDGDDGAVDDADLEPGVDIVAQPPGKRLKNLTMLSGGEKALTVLALMFASFLIRPAPFCILDEVDAPLDEPNVIRFARFLTQLTSPSQFLVITHNKRTMEVANSLFGVTMEEPGVSKFVSVRIADLEKV